MLKKALLGVTILILCFLGFVATRPAAYLVERSTTIEAPAEVVFAQLNNFKAWAAWSPWEKRDPAMKKTFSGPAEGKGATYAWQGNDEVGKGQMTIVESQAPTRVRCKLEFKEPMAAEAHTQFDLSSAAASGPVSVTWSMSGQKDFMTKVYGVFMDIEASIAEDYDKGLAALKTVAEKEAITRKQQEAQAAVEVPAEAGGEASAQLSPKEP